MFALMFALIFYSTAISFCSCFSLSFLLSFLPFVNKTHNSVQTLNDPLDVVHSYFFGGRLDGKSNVALDNEDIMRNAFDGKLSTGAGLSVPSKSVTKVVYQEDVSGYCTTLNEPACVWNASISGVQANFYYKVEYEVMQGDLGSSDEKVVNVTLNGVSVGGCNPTGDDYACTFASCNGENGNDKKDVVIFATSNSIAVTATYQEHSKDCDCDRSNADGLCSEEDTVTGRTPTRAALKFKLTPTTSQGILIGRHFSEDQAFSRVVLKSTINALGQFQSLVEHPDGVSSMDISFVVKVGHAQNHEDGIEIGRFDLKDAPQSDSKIPPPLFVLTTQALNYSTSLIKMSNSIYGTAINTWSNGNTSAWNDRTYKVTDFGYFTTTNYQYFLQTSVDERAVSFTITPKFNARIVVVSETPFATIILGGTKSDCPPEWKIAPAGSVAGFNNDGYIQHDMFDSSAGSNPSNFSGGWFAGNNGESCNTVCENKGYECDPDRDTIRSQADMQIIGQATGVYGGEGCGSYQDGGSRTPPYGGMTSWYRTAGGSRICHFGTNQDKQSCTVLSTNNDGQFCYCRANTYGRSKTYAFPYCQIMDVKKDNMLTIPASGEKKLIFIAAAGDTFADGMDMCESASVR